MSTTAVTWSTWSTNSWEVLVDAANSSTLDYAKDATDVAAKFTTTTKSATMTEFGRKSGAGNTWASIFGIPTGSTVTAVQVSAWKKKLVANTKISSNSVKINMIADDATRVSTADLISASLGTTTDGSYVDQSAGSSTSVSSTYQAATTNVRLSLEYTVTTIGSGGGAAIDCRFDDVQITITYTAGYIDTYTAGAFSISGTNATLKYGRLFGVSSGTYSITGTDANPRRTKYILYPGAASIVGGVPFDTFLLDTNTLGENYWYRITGTAATLTYASGSTNYTLIVNPGAFSITGTNATLKYGRLLSPSSGTYSITGTNASLLYKRLLTVSNGSYTISGTASTLTHGALISASSGTFNITGTGASLLRGSLLSVSSGTFLISGTDVNLSYSGALNHYTLSVSAGSFLITGTDGAFARTYKIIPGAGAISVTGTSSLLKYGRTFSAGTGQYTITGFPIAFPWTHILAAQKGHISLEGTEVRLKYREIVGRQKFKFN